MIFTRKETPEETVKRLLRLTNGKEYGLFPSPMDAQTALNELAHHLLGEDLTHINPMAQTQANTEIVYMIERKYKVKRIKRGSKH